MTDVARLAEKIGTEVKFRRERAGLSKQELSRRSGISRSYVAKIESGQRLPSIPILARIADAVGCSFGEFTAPLDLAEAKEETS